MTRSMTAFAALSDLSTGTELKWELRSVNSRYLETHFRLPDSYRDLEPQLRERLRAHLNRGKVEISLRVQDALGDAQLSVDEALVKGLLSAVEQVERHLPASTALSPLDLLKWPGVLQQQDSQQVPDEQALALFDQALASLCDGRLREGEKLCVMIEQRLDAITAILTELRQHLPEILARQTRTLQERIGKLISDSDPVRVEQEVVLLINKADVEEELDRLDAHLDEVRRVLKTTEPMGRRLDFLMQELNREANTLSSKSIAIMSTQAAIDLKVLIEQMREQIQNVE
ncbi:YicC/YloC family endoribonuclease [Nitrincola iocasae]|uniref:YicC family protein n=1 Tax=Nitrincola iocasae TaxID=2614693 RepID=A0A5J6L9F2_9GAMM|nr:YicC/YloC family endoribonuclease [Nitrincola iocasae]QEW05135.1 YicC family protein [Nitrincola iocasae]